MLSVFLTCDKRPRNLIVILPPPCACCSSLIEEYILVQAQSDIYYNVDIVKSSNLYLGIRWIRNFLFNYYESDDVYSILL